MRTKGNEMAPSASAETERGTAKCQPTGHTRTNPANFACPLLTPRPAYASCVLLNSVQPEQLCGSGSSNLLAGRARSGGSGAGPRWAMMAVYRGVSRCVNVNVNGIVWRESGAGRVKRECAGPVTSRLFPSPLSFSSLSPVLQSPLRWCGLFNHARLEPASRRSPVGDDELASIYRRQSPVAVAFHLL